MSNNVKVDAAVIFACGKGERMRPLTFDTPKSLLKVKGEVLIERQIRQLKEKNINEIYVMVGYLQYKFSYLKEKYNVTIIYNEEYLKKNTLSTLHKVMPYLKGKSFYLCYADIYIKENLFNSNEDGTHFKSVYIEEFNNEWPMTIDENDSIVKIDKTGEKSYVMVGIAYFEKEKGEILLSYCDKLYNEAGTENYYWEEIVVKYINDFSPYKLKRIPDKTLFEFDNYDEIRLFDKEVDTGSYSISEIKKAFNIEEKDIIIDSVCSTGITNNSYIFKIKGSDIRYIMRVPSFGTDVLIDRKVEAYVLNELYKYGLTEKVVYIDSKTGYKISEFIEGSKLIDANSESDLRFAMSNLKKLHKLKINIENTKNLIDWVTMYENSIERLGLKFPFTDYDLLKEKINKICCDPVIKNRKWGYCHGDANPTNMLVKDGKLIFIDLEYTNIFDQAFEIAMFALNGEFDHIGALKLLNYYLEADGDNDLFSDLSDEETEKLIIKYFAISQYYCYLWAIVFEYNKGVDYTDYKKDRHNILLNVLKYLGEI